MKRSLIISNFRIETRRKSNPYRSEARSIRYVNRFLDELSIVHSSQIRPWQIEYFISQMIKEGADRDELLIARSALRFLFDRVLRLTENSEANPSSEIDTAPGVMRITA